ncbi:hypothetical protein GBF38_006639, partial [Nibea albiflora]
CDQVTCDQVTCDQVNGDQVNGDQVTCDQVTCDQVTCDQVNGVSVSRTSVLTLCNFGLRVGRTVQTKRRLPEVKYGRPVSAVFLSRCKAFSSSSSTSINLYSASCAKDGALKLPDGAPVSGDEQQLPLSWEKLDMRSVESEAAAKFVSAAGDEDLFSGRAARQTFGSRVSMMIAALAKCRWCWDS